jgi:hypothetical protein
MTSVIGLNDTTAPPGPPWRKIRLYPNLSKYKKPGKGFIAGFR